MDQHGGISMAKKKTHAQRLKVIQVPTPTEMWRTAEGTLNATKTPTSKDTMFVRGAIVIFDEGAAKTYVPRIPKVIPDGSVLVHNHIRPTRRLGSRGFRAWLQTPFTTKVLPCDCGWAGELGQH